MLPTLRIWVLKGGKKLPLSKPYTLVGDVHPENYAGGMLDPVSCAQRVLSQKLIRVPQTTYVIHKKRYFIVSSIFLHQSLYLC